MSKDDCSNNRFSKSTSALKKCFYLFIYGSVGSSLLLRLFSSCGTQGRLSICRVRVSHCCGFSCYGAWALGPPDVTRCGTWTQQLRLPGSKAQVHGFGCCRACGIFPCQGWNPCLLHWQVDSLPLNHQGSLTSTFKSSKGVLGVQSPKFNVAFVWELRKQAGTHSRAGFQSVVHKAFPLTPGCHRVLGPTLNY